MKNQTNPVQTDRPKISIILPCRNEQEALPFCLQQIKKVILQHHLSAQIIVSDSSTDKSPQIAKRENVMLVKHDLEGYGRAYLEGFKHAKGQYIFMADADCSYDFNEIPRFARELENGYDLLIGNRLGGNIEKDAMPWANRHIGTPVLSLMLKMFFGANIQDSQSGMRAIKKESLQKLNLQTGGMEFASEIIVKAVRSNLKIKELPIQYYKRKGQSKLRPLKDAYKHIRFMLLCSPLFLFFIPGLALWLIGIMSIVFLYATPVTIFSAVLSYHPMFASSLLIITGYQLIALAGFAKVYSMNFLKEEDKRFEKLFKYITIEKASVLGLLITTCGISICAVTIMRLLAGGAQPNEIKDSIIALTLIAVGMQTIFSSYMLSILGIRPAN